MARDLVYVVEQHLAARKACPRVPTLWGGELHVHAHVHVHVHVHAHEHAYALKLESVELAFGRPARGSVAGASASGEQSHERAHDNVAMSE